MTNITESLVLTANFGATLVLTASIAIVIGLLVVLILDLRK